MGGGDPLEVPPQYASEKFLKGSVGLYIVSFPDPTFLLGDLVS